MTKITKAIIPAAGLGTRFLPQTKAMPKEMLPILDKPVIQVVVEELVEAGITEIIIVTGPQKRAIEDHFDRSLELEQSLIEKGKKESAEQIKEIAEMANFVYLRQKGLPKGNARPVMNAAHLLGNEPFFVIFPDDYFISEGESSIQQMINSYDKNNCPVLALKEIDKSRTADYGVIEPGEKADETTYIIKSLVEKPEPKDAPSNLISVNGYILTPDFLPYIDMATPDAGGEVGIAHAMSLYTKDQKAVGTLIEGDYFDCGSKKGYLDAIIYAAKKEGLYNA